MGKTIQAKGTTVFRDSGFNYERAGKPLEGFNDLTYIFKSPTLIAMFKEHTEGGKHES